MSASIRKSEPLLPQKRDISLADAASVLMSSFLSTGSKTEIKFSLKHSNEQETIEFFLTPTVVELIFKTLVHIAKGDAVTIVPYHAELTTQEAADFLQVSRPYLIQLLENGKIPFRKVGRHRRVLFEDLLKHKEQSRAKSQKLREELTQESQDLDLGY